MSLIKRTVTALLVLIILFISTIPTYAATFTGDDMIVVVLDPGHGGHDPGAAGVRSEAYYNLRVASYCKAALEANGNFKVYMTRSTEDKYLTLAERLWYAYTVDADICISIHFNSSSSSAVSGIEVYGSVLDEFYLGVLGQKISVKSGEAVGIQSRGVFRKYDYGSTLYYWSEEYQWDIPGDSSVGGLSDYYGIITWGAKFGIPSLIVEQAYLSNPTERQLIENEDNLRKMGEADAAAIIEYYTNHTHTYGETVIDMPVTCFSEGRQSEHCTVCGHRKNVRPLADSPDPSRHIWLPEGAAVAATCDTDGYGKFYCRYTHNLNDKGCTQFEVHRLEDIVPATGHDYQITYHSDVTHTVDGITTYTCTKCSASYTDTVSAEGHEFEQKAHLDPTCTTDGYDTYFCPTCNEEYSDIIPATGHTFKSIEHSAPTCTESGFDHRYCTTCDFEENLPLDALGHEIIIYSEVMANCTEEGFRETICSRCDFKEKEIWEKTGHSFIPTYERAPTCTESGSISSECIVCKESQTKLLDPLGHPTKDILEEELPTCTESGSRTEYCTVCGLTETIQLPATGHSFKKVLTLNEPGLFTDGEAEFACSNDPSHTEIKPIRDLTVYEYGEKYPIRLALMCGVPVLILAAGAAVLIILLRQNKPAHAKKKASGNGAPVADEVIAPETGSAADTTEKEVVSVGDGTDSNEK